MSSTRGRVLRAAGVVLTAMVLAIGFAFPAAAAELMRVTFVRHGQSEGNLSGLIDTKTPGPNITALGQQQAQAVVGTLGYHNYDAIYASQMVRTQQTAAPMADYLRLPVTVLPGIQEIEAGVFEGTPESQAAAGYGRILAGWALANALDVRIPGSIDGHEFDARMDQAMQTIYDNGDRNSVVFSHGGAIMFWTMMNAQNLTTAQKLALLQTAPLNNTNYVVVDGNNEDGWTLVNWNGQEFSPDRTLAAEFAVQLRTLTRQLASSATKIVQAIASFDFPAIVRAIGDGISDSVYSVVKFGRAMVTKVVADWTAGQTPTTTGATAAVATLASATTAKAEAGSTDTDTDTEAADTAPAATGGAAKAEAKAAAVEAKDEAAAAAVETKDEAVDATDETKADAKDDAKDEVTDDTDTVDTKTEVEVTGDADTVDTDSGDEAKDDSTSAAVKSDDTSGAAPESQAGTTASDGAAEHREAA